MSDPYAPNLYQKLYEPAVHLFDKGKFKACTKLAESNVADETLPRYYVIKNAILIVSAMDDWADAEVWKLAAEQAYITAFGKAKNNHSDNTREAFAELRYELDQLDMFKVRDFEALVALVEEDEERYEDDEEEYEEDDYEDDNNEDEGEDESEAKDEGAHASVEAETIDLQPASEHDSKTNPVPVIEVDTTTNGPFATSSVPKIHQKIGAYLCTHSPSHSAKAPAPALLAQAYWE